MTYYSSIYAEIRLSSRCSPSENGCGIRPRSYVLGSGCQNGRINTPQRGMSLTSMFFFFQELCLCAVTRMYVVVLLLALSLRTFAELRSFYSLTLSAFSNLRSAEVNTAVSETFSNYYQVILIFVYIRQFNDHCA
jgi:hypothetical protein